MNKPEKKRDLESYVRAFVEAFDGIAKHLAAAANVYVSALADENVDSEAFRRLCQDKCPTVPHGWWRRLEEVGHGRQHWKLLAGAGGEHEAKICRLPISVQSDIFKGVKFEMLTPGNDPMKVDVRTIGKDQARQVFAKDHIRTLAEQKAWRAENCKAEGEPEPTKIPSGFVGTGSKKRYRVRGSMEFTRSQWKAILLEW